MTHVLRDPIWLFQTLSALFYVLLGAWVLTLSPRRRQTTLLGAFAILYGLVFLVFDVSALLDLFPESGLLLTWTLSTPFFAGYAAALMALVWTTPEPLEDQRLLALALAVALVFNSGFRHLANVFLTPGWEAFDILSVGVGGLEVLPVLAVVSISSSLGQAAFLLLALRARPGRDPSPADVTQLVIFTVALGALHSYDAGWAIPQVARNVAQGLYPLLGSFQGSGQLAVSLIAAGVWLANMVEAGDETERLHRAAALSILGLMAVGALYRVAFPELAETTALGRGVARTTGVAILTYGVLRHDLAGLDEKVEYGVSRTTIAGIFVAVFFVVSEGAQAMFADFAGNEFLGVLAAGLLVFAISPLQRFADRFAAKAVPGGAEAGADVEERYRSHVEVALADGEIAREEEHELAAKASELGLDPQRALEIREQVEDEAGSGEGGDDA